MSARSKSALLVGVVLIIGMILGALLNARIAEQRLARISLLRTPAGLVRAIENAVEPESPEQREAIRSILDTMSVQIGTHLQNNRNEMRAIFDSTRSALEAILSAEQNAKLEKQLRVSPPNRGARMERIPLQRLPRREERRRPPSQ